MFDETAPGDRVTTAFTEQFHKYTPIGTRDSISRRFQNAYLDKPNTRLNASSRNTMIGNLDGKMCERILLEYRDRQARRENVWTKMRV